MAGYAQQKEDIIRRLRRIEGQVRGVQRMVDEDTYCIDVLTQVSAINAALQSCAVALLDEHLACCVTEAIAAGGDEAKEKVGEASKAIARLIRT
ncbi:metal-sensitive transcriptional regulator [Streptomyces sp. R302]|uniref:metal-sensing transcriptional repressor n=1 Tax=unclassified Streptomyces TaxID=2593676 RepID=UPI00145E1FD0|nr:metal-sensitive transcriptional regulator [Streptomyces sp. R301]NML79056.1 metal-sensitive transcriptional regulator [Streptomyces sp. R302]